MTRKEVLAEPWRCAALLEHRLMLARHEGDSLIHDFNMGNPTDADIGEAWEKLKDAMRLAFDYGV